MGEDCSIAVQDVQKMGIKKNAISDQDAVLRLCTIKHLQQTDVALPDIDYLGTPKDVVVTTGNNTKDKKHFPVAPAKLDGESVPVKIVDTGRKSKSRVTIIRMLHQNKR